MQKLIKCIALTAAFLLSSSITITYAALPTPIRFASEATYPPFEYMDPSGEIKGFDIDIAKALCTHMNAKCTFTNQPWDSLIPSLKLGKFDAVISTMEITPARKQQVDFTTPYFTSTASFVGPTGLKIATTPQELAGKTIGVQNGTTLETYLKNRYKNAIKIRTYANIQDAFLDLDSGRIDLLLGDTPVVIDWLNKHQSKAKYSLLGEPITDPEIFGVGYAIAIRKGNAELLDALNKAIAQIKSDGTLQRIAANYSLQLQQDNTESK